MRFSTARYSFPLLFFFFCLNAYAAEVVPTEILLPGTQPGETNNLESPDKCDNCHAGYNASAPGDEPATGWRGAAMGNAGRDPIFWATLAIAEQDFDGAGDLCIRCHSTGGWYGGRSTPTDASGLAASDSDGVDCDTCHSMTNTDDSEFEGTMNAPFIANCSDDPVAPDGSCSSSNEAYYGSGMLSLWPGSDKLGPYSDADARHQFMQSRFHRSVDFCGSCHDVSNSAVGDLAPGNGAQPGAPHVVSSQDFNAGNPDIGGPPEQKAAFNNPPYAYGVVERTFSEYKSSAWPQTMVANFNTLPEDLKTAGGSVEVTYQAALLAGRDGNYADGQDRYFSCQSCHMRPTVGAGADKRGVKIRTDLPQHDHTGGNYWLPDIIEYQDTHGLLRLGGDLSVAQQEALELGKARAAAHLRQAASLEVDADTNVLKVINLTGHKLISGYPEGRRMWLNIKWFDEAGDLLREDGAYGPLFDAGGQPVMVTNPADGTDVQVESILDLHDPNIRLYEAHYAISREWAETLSAVGKPDDFVLGYDRITGAGYTLGELIGDPAKSWQETFHFALNNMVVKDNRIPPYGMRYSDAKKRNALPVPESQYGSPAAGGVYNYWDELDLDLLKPEFAVSAQISLLYQGTSWEYIQFLDKANNGSDPAQGGNAFLGAEGRNMLEAWINAEIDAAMEVNGDHKMVPPIVMASTSWGNVVEPPPPDETLVGVAEIATGLVTGKKTKVFTATSTFTQGDTVVLRMTVRDENGVSVANAQVMTTITGPETFTLSGTSDAAGLVEVSWRTSSPNRKGAGGTATGSYTAAITGINVEGLLWDGFGAATLFDILPR